jgi:NADP-dependent 3-hydroxy acid dehydrogenase YdfG
LTILIASSRKSSGRRGKLDIVFANAGVAKYARLGAITEKFYDSIFNINVKGLLFTVQKALPLSRMVVLSS